MNKKIEEALNELYSEAYLKGSYDPVRRIGPDEDAVAECLAIIEAEMEASRVGYEQIPDLTKALEEITEVVEHFRSQLAEAAKVGVTIGVSDVPLSPQNPFPGNKPTQKIGFWGMREDYEQKD